MVHSIFFTCELRMAYSVLQKVVKTRFYAWGSFKLSYMQLNTFPFQSFQNDFRFTVKFCHLCSVDY